MFVKSTETGLPAEISDLNVFTILPETECSDMVHRPKFNGNNMLMLFLAGLGYMLASTFAAMSLTAVIGSGSGNGVVKLLNTKPLLRDDIDDSLKMLSI